LAFLVVEKGNEQDIGQVFRLCISDVFLGRSTPDGKPDIVLHGDYISRNHARIKCEQGCYTVCDLESRNGTTIDDRRLESGKYYPLKHGSVIGLGIRSEKPCVLLRFYESAETISIDEPNQHIVECVDAGWIKIDKTRKEVWIDMKLVPLSKKEYDLVRLLYDKVGVVCSKDEIIEAVWPDVSDPGFISDATVDQLVYRLRYKIETKKSRRIVSRKGFGYMLVP
jgi:two-component system, OmpR family, response regulator QseB